MRPQMISAGRLGALAFALALCAAPAATACGGFFCSLQQPVDQVGEQILFAVDGKDVTAHIQIQYQGEASSFSWVLPLPTVPEFAVGTDVLFQRLRALTDPKFEIDWQNDAGCNYKNQCPCRLQAASGGGTGAGGNGNVTVVAEGEVGPFQYQVVESEDGTALFDWLNENGYDQPPEAAGLIQYYTNQSFVFVALKLQKGKSTGDLQPIVVKYQSDTFACIPLKLTSVAASENMPVFSWVLAEARAVPMNYFHVTLNPKTYDWINCATPKDENDFWCGQPSGQVDCQAKYIEMVSAAADAANGHAFVTEFAGESALMADQIYTEGQYDVTKLEAAATPGAFLQELLSQSFPRNTLMQEVIKAAIPKPAEADLPEQCKDDRDFYSTGGIDECVKHMPEGWTFDPVAMAADVKERIVAPMEEAQALFGTHAYLTRLFTTVSPDEMTKDPVFSFNPDLPDVSNVHTVVAKAECKPGDSSAAQKVTLTFDDGEQVALEGDFPQCQGWLGGWAEAGSGGGAIAPADAAAEVQVMHETGEPEAVPAANIDSKEAEIEARTPVAGGPAGGTGGGSAAPGSGSGGSSSGCAAGGGGAPTSGLLLLVLLLACGIARARGVASAR